MADPITLSIAFALAAGFGQVGKTLIDEGVIKPMLKPAIERVSKRISGKHQLINEDQVLLKSVTVALEKVGAPKDPDKLTQYLTRWGFDLLQAKGNTLLRQEIAQAALLQTSPDPQLVPDRLFRSLRMPPDSRLLLARFLYYVREQLKVHDTWGVLIEQTRQDAVYTYLRRMAHDMQLTASASEQFNDNLQLLLHYYGLHADKPDGEALQEYIAHLISEYQHLAFVLTKARRRERLSPAAELDAVFVPLQVQDSELLQSQSKQTVVNRPRLPSDKHEVKNILTINEVLAKHPVFLLLGAPGSGKTTLFRHLTVSFARGEASTRLDWAGTPLLPILVPLRNFGRFLTQNQSRYTNPAPQALREFIADYFTEHDLELGSKFFRDRLKQGACLVLLDGLDEVADRDERARVAQFVNQFIKRYVEKGNRFGLASRPRGYEQVQSYLKRPVVCTVQPLTPSDRDRLVANLLIELEPNARIRYQNTQDLIADIRRKEKVDTLSRNPLFCTTLVLVYKYQGATLPDRRVDVYQELVNLMLGFWETHKVDREGVADVHELVLLDGTGRDFMDEREAVEAKERTLKHLAGWMQTEGLTDVPKAQAVTVLATYFEEYEGASSAEKEGWAKNFLDVAHQRSGLFVELDTGVYAFAHKSFLEYLAATTLIDELDQDMLNMILAHATDPSWEEVIRLAFAHEKMPRKRYKILIDGLLSIDQMLLAGRCIIDAGARLPVPLRRCVQDVLYDRMTDSNQEPKARYEAGELLDESGWLPLDLNKWIRCPGRADNHRDLWAMKYPVTNVQFNRFVLAGGYNNPAYWEGEDSVAWQWKKSSRRTRSQVDKYTDQPAYWHDARLGKERHGYPVVGVSWYEAIAYAAWLTDLLHNARQQANLEPQDRELIADLLETDVTEIHLPSETEWVRMAGGEGGRRYPWDMPGHAVTAPEQVLLYANVDEANIKQTTPVYMYPQGVSHPFGLMDMSGNAWEWTNSWYNEATRQRRILGGGSWDLSHWYARVSARFNYDPEDSYSYVGFRVVSTIELAS